MQQEIKRCKKQVDVLGIGKIRQEQQDRSNGKPPPHVFPNGEGSVRRAGPQARGRAGKGLPIISTTDRDRKALTEEL